MPPMPRARPHLVEVQVASERLVYDPSSARCHRLDANASALLGACDGQTATEVAAAALHPDLPAEAAGEVLALGLRRLEKAGLVETVPAGLPRVTRRGLLARWGRLAAALPVVATLAVPHPAWAQSAGCTDCTADSTPCFSCPDGICGPCMGTTCTCGEGACLVRQRPEGTNCLTDTEVSQDCVDMSVAQPAFVNPDCAVARANVAPGTVTYCDGTTQFFNATAYYCCTNCTS